MEKGEIGWRDGAFNSTLSGPRAHLYLQSDPVPQSIRITLIQPPTLDFILLFVDLIREIVLLKKQVTQLGAGKESLARFSPDLCEKEC